MSRLYHGGVPMKKIVALFALMAFFAGCSNDNKITIRNITEGTVHFNFRAKTYDVPPEDPTTASYVIPDIPNGTFTYACTFSVPDNLTIEPTVEGTAGSGSLLFEKKDTQILMLYSVYSSAGTYKIQANMTSSISSSSPTQ